MEGAAGAAGAAEGPASSATVSWDAYFDERRVVSVPRGDFAVYTAGNRGAPATLLLLHGGGLSSESWALFAKECVGRLSGCAVVAVDFRGHGGTSAEPESDLSKETLCEDVLEVVAELRKEGDWEAVYVCGHSMGGAVAVHLAATGRLPGVAGVVVVDVAEGSALDAVMDMKGFLESRPSSFPSVDAAVDWCVGTGAVRNRESAAVSVPPQFAPAAEGGGGGGEVRWRVDLVATEPHWRGWFDGLSEVFLGLNVPRLLILAGITTLDKDLTIGQMQGKYQLEVFDGVGHCLHEDAPARTAQTVARFVQRFDSKRKALAAAGVVT